MMKRFFGLVLISLALCGCKKSREPQSFALMEPPLPHLTKDDVLRVNGKPLSITAYMAIRSKLKEPTKNNVLWVGTAALAMIKETSAQGKELSPTVAIDIARYALGDLPLASADASLREYLGQNIQQPAPPPEDLKTQLDQFVARAVIQRNLRVLAEL